VEGVERPTGFYKGVAGAVVTDYSDNLLMFLLKGLRPAKYRDRHEVTGGIGLWGRLDVLKMPPVLIQRVLYRHNPATFLNRESSSRLTL
jgi:hypothetical protein